MSEKKKKNKYISPKKVNLIDFLSIYRPLIICSAMRLPEKNLAPSSPQKLSPIHLEDHPDVEQFHPNLTSTHHQNATNHGQSRDCIGDRHQW